MPRPGVDILISEPTPSGGGVTVDTGLLLMLGVSGRGPVDTPLQLRSIRDYERRYGPRADGQVAHDSARAFFTERGAVCRFLRLAGDGVKAAEAELGTTGVEEGGWTMRASAASPGSWGNDLTIGIEAPPLLAGNGSQPVRMTVTDGQAVERSQPVTTVEQAVAWSQSSSYVRLDADAEDLAGALQVLEAVELSGGVDDRTVTAATVETALKRFGYGIGFAQVAYPGATDATIHAAILAHAERNRRPALLDLDDQDETTLAADAVALHANSGARFACALAPRLVYAGPAPGTTVLVPFSAVQAGLIARADRTTGNPNESAAGTNGQSIGARGLGRDFPDDAREELNELGVTLARVMRNGAVRTYGSRTVAGPDELNWRWFPGSRVVLAIAHECDGAAEEFVHRQIDGQRRLFTRLEVALGGICMRWWNMGALYGETPEEAFIVDAGPGVNTDDTIDAGEVHAIVKLHTAPPGEWVVIELQKSPLAQAV